MSDNKRYSFTSANSFPVKVLHNLPLIKSIVENGKIIPIHLQLNPVNECNFHCSFCSCKNRNTRSSLAYDELKSFLTIFKELGGQSSTVTGGGEPLAYREMRDLLYLHRSLNLDVGMVCNGSYLNRLKTFDFSNTTWIRVSCSDELPIQINLNMWFKTLETAVALGKDVDWAFSYVVGHNPSIELIAKIVTFANEHHFTHVRLVSDLLSLSTAEDMQNIKHKLKQLCIPDSKVIYQGRKEFTHGAKKCYISLAKPVVSADGGLYPCCSTQYAEENPSLDYGVTMRMGSMFDLPKLVEEQKFFSGEKCVRCYYNDYNIVFDWLLQKLQHGRFI